ncbi:MAG: mannose-6-phosphate isomerase, class I [Lachnospiraceae bacterium]|nr:mannose-6-phosphate isomerase, class I [Lachnospiraceae bacterium]
MVIRFKPVFSHTIWGGDKLRTEWGYDEKGDDIGECWTIAAHPHGDVIVDGGEFDGMHLSELWNKKRELFGNAEGDRFPLLIKIITASDDLSIQVHPDDEYAGKYENGSLGKTESWYIIDCEKDSKLVVGHNAKTKEELCRMIDEGRWSEFIREIPIKKGDIINIVPGTVHAIKGGITLLESQQNSDITYRVYDYDRKKDGKLRELHIEKSKDVITVPALDVKDSIIEDDEKETVKKVISCKYFDVFRIIINGKANFSEQRPFLLFTVIEGEGEVEGEKIKKGDAFMISAGYEKVDFSGKMKLIVSSLPD